MIGDRHDPRGERHRDLDAWWEQLRDWRDRYPLVPVAGRWHSSPQYVVERIGKLVGPDAVYVAGVGQHQMWAAQFISYGSRAPG